MFNIYEKMVNYCFSEMKKNNTYYHTKKHIAEVLLSANALLKDFEYNNVKKEKIVISNLKMKSDLKETELNLPLSVFIALLFHDVVYDVSSKTNEYDSAIKMYSYVCENFKTIMYEKEDEVNLAYAMILATKDHKIPAKMKKDGDYINISETDISLFKVVLDVDMLTLSKDYDDFLLDSKLIEKEYRKIYSQDEYDIGRIDFLTKLLDKKIYLIEKFDLKNDKAKLNIQKYIDYKDRLIKQRYKKKYKEIFS